MQFTINCGAKKPLIFNSENPSGENSLLSPPSTNITFEARIQAVDIPDGWWLDKPDAAGEGTLKLEGILNTVGTFIQNQENIKKYEAQHGSLRLNEVLAIKCSAPKTVRKDDPLIFIVVFPATIADKLAQIFSSPPPDTSRDRDLMEPINAADKSPVRTPSQIKRLKLPVQDSDAMILEKQELKIPSPSSVEKPSKESKFRGIFDPKSDTYRWFTEFFGVKFLVDPKKPHLYKYDDNDKDKIDCEGALKSGEDIAKAILGGDMKYLKSPSVLNNLVVADQATVPLMEETEEPHRKSVSYYQTYQKLETAFREVRIAISKEVKKYNDMLHKLDQTPEMPPQSKIYRDKLEAACQVKKDEIEDMMGAFRIMFIKFNEVDPLGEPQDVKSKYETKMKALEGCKSQLIKLGWKGKVFVALCTVIGAFLGAVLGLIIGGTIAAAISQGSFTAYVVPVASNVIHAAAGGSAGGIYGAIKGGEAGAVAGGIIGAAVAGYAANKLTRWGFFKADPMQPSAERFFGECRTLLQQARDIEKAAVFSTPRAVV